MTRASKTGIAWTGALAALMIAAACSKTSDEPGGESHFSVCRLDTDCEGAMVCVRQMPTDEEGECRVVSYGMGAGGADSGTAETGGTTATGGAQGTSNGGSQAGNGGSQTGDGGSQTGDGGSIDTGQCSQLCCPPDVACYGTPDEAGWSGRECLALRDNTGQERIQLRQTSTLTLLPVGLANPQLQQARQLRTQYPLTNCFGSSASNGGRFIPLLNIEVQGEQDEAKAWFGYSRAVLPDMAHTELADGLCMAWGVYEGAAEYRLNSGDVGSSPQHPSNGPPRALGANAWILRPTEYLRETRDFNLATDREALLMTQSGSFFYDEARGRFHAYTRRLDMIHYDSNVPPVPSVIPVRELETRLVFNDPAHPNCVGALTPSPAGGQACSGTVGWTGVECEDGICTPATEAAAEYTGYMLIAELEQVYDPTLLQTLCVAAMGRSEAEAAGFLTEDRTSCKSSRWDPAAADDAGLPPGDWCAATNSPATTTCHDAFRLHERATFAATRIRIDSTVPARPAACPFQ